MTIDVSKLTTEEKLAIVLKERDALANQFPRLDCLHDALSRSHDEYVGKFHQAEQEKLILVNQLTELGNQFNELKRQIDERDKAIIVLNVEIEYLKNELQKTQDVAMAERKQLRELQAKQLKEESKIDKTIPLPSRRSK